VRLLSFLTIFVEFVDSHIRNRNIKSILNVTDEPDIVIEGISYLQLDMQDHEECVINETFERAHQFISKSHHYKIQRKSERPSQLQDDAKQNGHAVLVHCEFGISRSATIVYSYLIKHNDMSLKGLIPSLPSVTRLTLYVSFA
jgi:hypothetical protein